MDIAIAYDSIAQDYANKRCRPGEKMKLALPYLAKGMRILDLGCAHGRFYELIPQGVNYIGLDISKNLLIIARKKYPKAKFIYGDMTNEKVWQKLGKFDAIFSFASFHHLMNKKDQAKVLGYFHQSLKDKGLLMIVVWNLWQKKYQPYHQGNKKRLQIPWHLSDGKKIVKSIPRECYAFTQEELKNLLGNQRFKIEREFFTQGDNLTTAKEFGIVARKC